VQRRVSIANGTPGRNDLRGYRSRAPVYGNFRCNSRIPLVGIWRWGGVFKQPQFVGKGCCRTSEKCAFNISESTVEPKVTDRDVRRGGTEQHGNKRGRSLKALPELIFSGKSGTAQIINYDLRSRLGKKQTVQGTTPWFCWLCASDALRKSWSRCWCRLGAHGQRSGRSGSARTFGPKALLRQEEQKDRRGGLTAENQREQSGGESWRRRACSWSLRPALKPSWAASRRSAKATGRGFHGERS